MTAATTGQVRPIQPLIETREENATPITLMKPRDAPCRDRSVKLRWLVHGVVHDRDSVRQTLRR